jgi:hypothetical protein
MRLAIELPMFCFQAHINTNLLPFLYYTPRGQNHPKLSLFTKKLLRL